MELLARAVPERPLPPLDDTTLESWLGDLCAGKRRFDELRSIDLREFYRSRLSWDERRFLDEEAPDSLPVPTGRALPLRYAVGGAPVLAVKLQELFGLAETPRVAKGRVPVVLHLLSPAGRPVQVTSDLTSFWNTTYKDVRKDLRGRYPKHPWPDDPWNAPPMRGTTRRGR